MNLLDLQSDPAKFREHLLIDTDAGPVKLADVQDDWQARDFAALDAGWKRAAGQKVDGEAYGRAWLERPRGHTKSCDVMVMATWALFAARKQVSGVVVAVDRDQAKLDRDHVERLVRFNPWLQPILKVDQWRVTNVKTGSSLEILASDVASSYGLLVDFAVCDEVTLWPKRDLFDSILSAIAKKSTAMLLCIGNAGFQDSWQWSLREAIRQDPAWLFSRLDGAVASWITEANLQEQRRLLPQVAWNRLWMNLWSTGGGDALEESAVLAAFDDSLRPMDGKEKGWRFVAGADLSLTRDYTSVVVLAIPDVNVQKGYARIRLATARLWKPPKTGGKINLLEIESHVLDLDRQFKLEAVVLDAWQAEHLGQRLEVDSRHRRRDQGKRRNRQPWVRTIQPTGAILRQQASLTIESFADRRLQLYDYPPLRNDLLKLRAVEKSYGLRLESPRDGEGHGDTFSAFALALLVGHEVAGKKRIKLRFMDQPDPDATVPAWRQEMDAIAEREMALQRHEAALAQRPGAGWPPDGFKVIDEKHPFQFPSEER